MAEIANVADSMDRYNLDFDDAYQYLAAEQNGLVIVRFDGDFETTPTGKKTPADILSTL